MSAEEVQSRIGVEVRSQRARLGWTQEKLAARSGISEQSISAIENGERDVKATTATKLADALGVTVGQLVDGS